MRSFYRVVGIAFLITFFKVGVQAQITAIHDAQKPSIADDASSTAPRTPESFDIGKPDKPNSVLSGTQSSDRSYAALGFPVLKPRYIIPVDKNLAMTSVKSQVQVQVKDMNEIGSKLSARSWVIPEQWNWYNVAGKVEAEIAEPKISLTNPSMRLRINPSESKLSGRMFPNPSLDLLGPVANFQATAYSLRGFTASGVYVRRGVIAADPRIIPIGSVVQLITPGYSGIYTVHDTGGKIKGRIVDVWVGSRQEALLFGRRQIKIHILRYGPKGRMYKPYKPHLLN